MPKSRIQRRVNPAAAPVEVKIDTLTQGVSQQPPHIRAIGQGTEQINGWSSPVEGLTKRNPFRLSSKLLNQSVEDFYLAVWRISATEQYSIFIWDGYDDNDELRLEVWRDRPDWAPMDSTKVDVHGTGLAYDVQNSLPGWKIETSSYLANTAAKTAKELYKGYVLTSSGPLGLLANRNVSTAYTSDTTPDLEKWGLVFIQSVAYSIKYTLNDGDTEIATFTTPKSDDDLNEISTTKVAEELFNQIPDTYEKKREQYVIWLKKKDNTDMDLKMDDSRSNALARAFTDSVALTSYLPLVAKNNYRVKVENDPGTDIDDLWLKFETFNNSDMGEGNWSECPAPGVKYKLDDNTMPLVLYRQAENKIFIGPADGTEEDLGGTKYTFPKWGERTAGNTETVPDPDFLDQPIRDHQIFRQRYTVLAGESIVFSETDDAFNFFLDTAQQITATDSFSLRCQSEVSSPLEWMLAVDDSILTFSAKSQFQIRAADGDVLTPLTGIVVRLSNIDMNPNVRPKKAGAQVLFPSVEYGFTHFREYQFFNATQRRLGLNLGGSNDTMLNLPKYLPGLVTHFDVGEAVDFAVASSPDDRSILYIYKYLWTSGDGGIQKVQASWSKWKLSGNVRWFQFIDNVLSVILDDGNDLYGVTYFADEIETEDAIQPHLDRLLLYPDCNEDTQTTNDVTATYNATTDKTTFVLPYTPLTTAVAGIRYLGQTNCGLILGSTTTSTLVCTEDGDFTDAKVFFGEKYDFEYTFTTAFVPEPDQAKRRTVGNLEGRTQVLTWQVNHYNTGYYQVRVKRQNRATDTVHTFRARQLAVSNTTLTNTAFLADGHFRVPVYCKNLEATVSVESDNHLPIVLTSACWEGAYSNRARAIN